jgi:dCTP deaminase
MALSDAKILSEIEAGNIVISPFNKDQLSTSSYDVTLGEWFYRPRQVNLGDDVYNIWSEEQTKKFWQLEQAAEAGDRFNYSGSNIAPTDKIILIRPGETILGHTNEFLGGRRHITTMMKARSSMGRQLIAVCKCAGWGDVGYINRWTMEITNYSRNYTIPLVVGRRVAQIIFFETGQILDRDYTALGKYQTSATLDELMSTWKPEDMLPKLWKDREIKV